MSCLYLFSNSFSIAYHLIIDTRALFEKALATLPPSKSDVIWSKFLDYENKYGDLQGMQNVEKRRREALPSSKHKSVHICFQSLYSSCLVSIVTNTQSFLERHSYLDVHSIEELDLGAEGIDDAL